MGGLTGASSPRGSAARDDRRRALEARLYGGEPVTSEELAELRSLVAPRTSGSFERGADPAPDLLDDSDLSDAEPTRAVAEPVRFRPGRAWLAAAAVAVVVAGLAGAGVSASIAAAGARAGSGAGEETPVPTRGASSPATGITSGAVADALGEEYFDQPQSPGDRPDVVLPAIDPSTTRRVLAQWGQQDGEAGVWVARGRDHSFCLIMSVGSTRGASSCTPLKDAAATGVRLDLVTAGGGSITATWNLAAGLLELSPFPASDTTDSITPPPVATPAP
ncbi:hypothetical protein [Frondihabitans peucedani]|uniref:Anti-sigma factor n=1 Tax=Frondihabitans peucedani TaxID=598626 RepID=A0ABP8DZ53_9MICO